MKRVLMVCLLLVLLAAAAATPVMAQGPDGGGQVVFGRNLTLASGEQIDGDLVIFGGSFTGRSGSAVNGDLVLFGGNAVVEGRVRGNVAVIGGNVDIRAGATIDGDVSSLGGNVRVDAGATVHGKVVRGFEGPGFSLPIPPAAPDRPFGDARFFFDFNPFAWYFGTVSRILSSIIWILFFVAMGVLAILILERPTTLIADTLMREPLVSGGVGLLTMVVAVAVIALLVITICLAPFGLLLALAFFVALIYGWVAAGYLIGRRLVEAATKKPYQPLVPMVVGVAFISLLYQVPCVGFLFGVVVAALGLGAVVLTRFGSRPYGAGGGGALPPAAGAGAEGA